MKIAHVSRADDHTLGDELGRTIPPRREEGSHGVDVVGGPPDQVITL